MKVSLSLCRFFLKEGVVHAMEQLAATAPKEAPKTAAKDAVGKGKSEAKTAPIRRSSSRLKVPDMHIPSLNISNSELWERRPEGHSTL
jgi:hypothetical protein